MWCQLSDLASNIFLFLYDLRDWDTMLCSNVAKVTASSDLFKSNSDLKKTTTTKNKQTNKTDNNNAVIAAIEHYKALLFRVITVNPPGFNSRVHIWISKPIPIWITLIRMTFHGIDRYFKPTPRLPVWHPSDPD